MSVQPVPDASSAPPPAPALQRLAGPEQAIAWLRTHWAVAVPGVLRTDSRQVLPGDIFIAWPGALNDGRQHVGAALQRGAVACLVEAAGAEAFAFDDTRVAALPGLKAAAGAIAHVLARQPSEALRVLAVTGTNGKTSTSWWLAQALTALGTRCGVVGTLGVGELGRSGAVAGVQAGLQAGLQANLQDTGLTTPDAVSLHAALAVMRDAGVQACAMEASSIGIAEHRMNALHVEVALFTNLTQDHLDYHHTMAAYWVAKRRLFSWPGLRAAVVNIDDAHGAQLAAELTTEKHGNGPQLWTVALDGAPARLQGLRLRYDHEGLSFDVLETSSPQQAPITVQSAVAPITVHSAVAPITVHSAVVGRFNASNLLVVLGGLRALGVPLQAACAALADLSPVPGRMQRVSLADPARSDIEVVVDYAHTPDALEQVLQSLAPLAASRGGRLWCVVGCGGNRDASKRPLMGAAAARLAQQVVLTSDNPRSEDPARILQHMLAGIAGSPAWQQQVLVIEDRRAAVRHAVLAAAPGDVVLLAGKGHEHTQEVAGLKQPFSDEAEARLALMARAAATQALAQPLSPVVSPC